MQHLDGTISNPSSGSFLVDIESGDQSFSDFVDAQGPTSVNKSIVLRLPANLLINPTTYLIDLAVSGGSAYGENSTFLGDGMTDFGNTAAFDHYYFGDENGNPTSGNGEVSVFGDIGQYGGLGAAAVPEPGHGLLLALGSLAAAGARRFRSRVLTT